MKNVKIFINFSLFSIKFKNPSFFIHNTKFYKISKFDFLSKKGLYKYDQEIYDLFMDSFDLIPLACVINGKFLAVHGGISPELKTVY